MRSTISPFHFTIKYGELAITPAVYPTITRTKATKSVTVATKRKNRAWGSCKHLDAKINVKMTSQERDAFKRICRIHGKGMTEVLASFVTAYTIKSKGSVINKLLDD